MLETSAKHVVCGAIIDNDEVTELYCNIETGDVAYEGTIDGTCMLIGEVSVDDPLPVSDIRPISRNLLENRYDGAIGVILCESKAIAILPGEVAEIRSLGSADKATGDTFNIDMDQEYQID